MSTSFLPLVAANVLETIGSWSPISSETGTSLVLVWKLIVSLHLALHHREGIHTGI
jgi:hypothetical protein